MVHLLPSDACRTFPISREAARALLGLFGLLACSLLGGCAALTNPVADGVPASRLPEEITLGRGKDEEVTIPLTLLRQLQPEVYRLDNDDILGIYIEGVVGERTLLPPVRLPETGSVTPVVGYPVTVREDGTISLPYVERINVRGMSLTEVEDAIRQAYTVKAPIILKPGRERISVSLVRKRFVRVFVERQDSGNLTVGPGGAIGNARRGSGFTLDLPAYENDVLTALNRTGGLPGADAYNAVVIQRGGAAPGGAPPVIDHLPPPRAEGGPSPCVYIPLRMKPGESPPFHPEDILLHNGDIVFIESRDKDVFYVGGLLQAGEYPLPRDRDLDVVEAIALVRGPILNGGVALSNLNGTLVSQGIGDPSPSLVSILRRTPGNRQLTIRVDLNRALRDPRERVVIKPLDVIILQETMGEAMARYFTQTVQFSLIWQLIHGPHETGTATTVLPLNPGSTGAILP